MHSYFANVITIIIITATDAAASLLLEAIRLVFFCNNLSSAR